ncbi:DUF2306 domain-containing protein [Acidobacterium sp. S8]|uniref:DUF2306 domain-containing protein n=1 Tax=Acidobacterium sp. S8 TaxID=1641854 RepID=UPI00131BCACD|nr:DUF2306 domain-containing protein [Acidobacterium sp. S8]
MQDPLWMKSILAVHITAGASAFLLAPLALLTAKGGKAHRRWGVIYFWAMAVVAVTALVMAFYRPVLFLGLVAIFSFYSAFVGYRVLGQKAAYKGEKTVTTLDWLALVVTFIASFALAFFGAVKPALVQHLGIPAIVFGALGMWIAGTTAWKFTHRPKEKMFWWYAHISGMLGSYIAAWTAFSVVTIGPLLHGAWWIWVVPTGIGVPAIVMTRAYYQKKFTPCTHS